MKGQKKKPKSLANPGLQKCFESLEKPWSYHDWLTEALAHIEVPSQEVRPPRDPDDVHITFITSERVKKLTTLCCLLDSVSSTCKLHIKAEASLGLLADPDYDPNTCPKVEGWLRKEHFFHLRFGAVQKEQWAEISSLLSPDEVLKVMNVTHLTIREGWELVSPKNDSDLFPMKKDLLRGLER